MITDEEKKDLKIEQARERLIRWESNRRELLGNAINVVLALSTGLLGFIANIIKIPATGAAYWWIYLFLGLSILFAVLAGYMRFFDFRNTTELNRLEYYDLLEGTDRTTLIDSHRKKASIFSDLTLTMVFLQILTFCISVSILCLM